MAHDHPAGVAGQALRRFRGNACAPLEDILPTLKMPSFLYVGEADGILPQVKACVKQMTNVTFVSFPGFDHADAFYRADAVLTPITEFLQAQQERMKAVV